MITPTVGRIVYYKPHEYERQDDNDQPYMANIVRVHSDDKIAVLVTNDRGMQGFHPSITLAQDREPREGECYWMPFQVGQARKDADKAAEKKRPGAAHAQD